MTDPGQTLDQFVADSQRTQSEFFARYRSDVVDVAEEIARRVGAGGKVLFFGNGGSAADAQHMAAEFVGRFIPDRRALPAMSLATDTSILTALGNDYGYEMVFARQVEAYGQESDVAVGISTSGNSPNVVAGLDAARQAGLYTIGFTGETGGKLVGRVDALFRVPSTMTPRIQETHILLGHCLCELVDRRLFPDAYAARP